MENDVLNTLLEIVLTGLVTIVAGTLPYLAKLLAAYITAQIESVRVAKGEQEAIMLQRIAITAAMAAEQMLEGADGPDKLDAAIIAAEGYLRRYDIQVNLADLRVAIEAAVHELFNYGREELP